MKFIKGLLIAFVVSCVFAVSNASAFGKAFVGITIPKLKGTWTSPDSQEKLDSGYQYLYTAGIRDNITGELRKVEASTIKVTEGNKASLWKKVTVDKTINWGDENKYPGFYKLRLRAQTSTIATVSYSGSWYSNE